MTWKKSIKNVTSLLFLGNWKMGVAWASRKIESLIY